MMKGLVKALRSMWRASTHQLKAGAKSRISFFSIECSSAQALECRCW
jgi:hypothetical protein